MENEKTTHALTSRCRAFLKTSVSLNLRPFAHLIYWLALAAGITADLWTKVAIFNWFSAKDLTRVTIIPGFVDFVTYLNDGAAFGFASGRRHFLVAVSLVAILVILLLFLFGSSRSPWLYLCYGLFTAGICGNLYDRIFNNGHVRDFIDVYYKNHHWPAFNVADSLLCIAVAVIFLHAILCRPSPKHAPQQK